MTTLIDFGTHKVPITAQAWPRLKHLIPKELSREDLDQLAEGEGDLASQLAAIGTKAYRLLVILAPALGDAVPEYAFHGYASQAAMDSGEYDDDAASKAPSLRQIVDAFDTALEENGVKKLGQLMQVAQSGQSLLGGVTGAPPANGRPTTPTSSD